MPLSNGFVQNGATTPLDARMMESARFVRTPSGAVRSGVLWTSAASGNVVGSLSSMAVVVVQADFLVSRTTTDGAVVLSNNGNTNVTLDAAPSSNSRIDVIWVKQNDSTQGDATSTAAFGKTTGTAAASPTKPAIPTGAVELATVLIPAGVTATNASGVSITNTFQYAASVGGPVRYRSESEMRADVANVNTGTLAYVTNGGEFYNRGTYWSRVDAATFAVILAQTDQSITSGTTANTLGGSNANGSTSDATLLPIAGGNVVGPLLVAGWYEVAWSLNFTSNSTGERYGEITQNDVSYNPPAAERRPASATSNMSGDAVLQFNAGDYVKLKGWQNSGSTLSYRSRLTVKLLRAN